MLSFPALQQAAVISAHSAAREASVDEAGGVAWTFRHENVLGTSLDLTLRAATHAAVARAEGAVLAAIDRDNLILSGWRAESEFSRWAGTVGRKMPVSAELYDVLALFDHWRERTAGALNPAAETAARLWKLALAEGRVPSAEELAAAAMAMAQQHWALSSDAGRFATRLTDQEQTPLVLASLAKSYVADRAANAALAAGARGVIVNLGGDLVVRGDLSEGIGIADPRAHSENDAALDRIVLRDRAVATSGTYRRRVGTGEAAVSHLFDPGTARPVDHVLSSTVVAQDATTAGALATAFAVMPVDDSRRLAAATPGVEYMLLARDGRQIASEGWASYRAPSLRTVAYARGQAGGAGSASASSQAYELAIDFDITRSDDYRYRRPYVAVWIEDQDHFPVRTLALWASRQRWLPDLRAWYRDDQVRYRAEGGEIADSISSATRAPGRYSLKWDGKDNHGKAVKPGKYTVCIEAAREHGSYQIERQELDLAGGAKEFTLPAGSELGAVTLDYRRR